MKGSCLCYAVRFEITGTPTAFDLCHCSRCREASGSAFLAELEFKAAEFQVDQRKIIGQNLRGVRAQQTAGVSKDILHGVWCAGADSGSEHYPHPGRNP